LWFCCPHLPSHRTAPPRLGFTCEDLPLPAWDMFPCLPTPINPSCFPGAHMGRPATFTHTAHCPRPPPFPCRTTPACRDCPRHCTETPTPVGTAQLPCHRDTRLPTGTSLGHGLQHTTHAFVHTCHSGRRTRLPSELRRGCGKLTASISSVPSPLRHPHAAFWLGQSDQTVAGGNLSAISLQGGRVTLRRHWDVTRRTGQAVTAGTLRTHAHTPLHASAHCTRTYPTGGRFRTHTARLLRAATRLAATRYPLPPTPHVALSLTIPLPLGCGDLRIRCLRPPPQSPHPLEPFRHCGGLFSGAALRQAFMGSATSSTLHGLYFSASQSMPMQHALPFMHLLYRLPHL